MARIVFDLDGTLVDSIPTLAATANRLLVELDRAPLPEATVVRFVGDGVVRLVERVLVETGGIPGGEAAPFVTRFRTLYDEDPLTGTVTYPGVAAALAALAAAGHGLGVCTQKPDSPALAILRGLDLMPPITAFTGGDSTPVLKPDPAMLAHTTDQLAPGPALMVGDSEVDAETARRAGIPFLLHIPGYRKAPVEALPHAVAFDCYDDLPRLVADLLA